MIKIILLFSLFLLSVNCNTHKKLIEVKIISVAEYCESFIKAGECVMLERKDTKERFIEFGHFGKIGDIFNMQLEVK